MEFLKDTKMKREKRGGTKKKRKRKSFEG